MHKKQTTLCRVVADHLNQFRLDNGGDPTIWADDVADMMRNWVRGNNKVDLIRAFRTATTLKNPSVFFYDEQADHALNMKLQKLVEKNEADTCMNLRDAKHLADWATANWA